MTVSHVFIFYPIFMFIETYILKCCEPQLVGCGRGGMEEVKSYEEGDIVEAKESRLCVRNSMVIFSESE